MMVDDVAPEALQIDDGKDTRLKSSSSPSSVSKTTNNIKENDNDEDAKYSLLMSLLIIHLPIELFISVAKFFLPLFGFLIELCFPYISKKKLRQMAKYSNQNPVLNDNDNENIPESIEHTEENNNDNKLQDTPNSELETGIDLLQKMQWQETENSDIQSTDRKKERSRIERFIHLLNKRLSAIAEKLKLKKPSNRAVVLSGATLSEVERQANSERSMNACSISGDIDNEALDNNSNKSGVSSIADDTNIVSALNTTSVSTVTNKSTYYDTMIPDHWRSKPILLEVKQPVSIHQSSQSVDNATSVRSRSNSALDSAKQLLGFKTSTDNSKRKSERTKKRKVNELDLKYKLMLDPRVNPNVRRSRRQEDFNLFLTVIVLIYCSVCGFDFSSRYCNWKYRAMIRYFNECNIKSIGQEVWSNILPTNLSDSSVFQILSSGFNTTFIDQKYINQIIVSQSLSLASTKQHIVAALKPILAGEVTFTDIKYAFWSQLEVLYSSMKTNEYVTRYSAVTYEYLYIVQNQLFSAIKYTQSSYRYIVVIIDGLKLKKVTLDDMLVSSNSTFNDHYFYCTEYFYYIRNQFIHSKYDITKLVYIKAIIRQLDQVMRMKAKSTVAFYKPILPSKTFANTTDTIDSVNLSAADMEYLALSPYNLQTILEIITCLVLIFMTYHRLCAYIILYTFRLVMSRSILFTGIFDVHCEWIAIRGMFPYFEVVIRNFIWRNPPQFKKTPYLLYCQHFRIQFNILDWYKTIRYGRKCKYGSVEVNTLDIFHEKVDRGTEEESLNLWVALGAEDSDSESAWLRLLFKSKLLVLSFILMFMLIAMPMSYLSLFNFYGNIF